MKVAIIGAGVSGCTAAHLLKQKGYDVKIFERSNGIGGGVWTKLYAGHPYTFGPRIFFTPDEGIISFVNDIIRLKPITNYTISFVKDESQFFNYPIFEQDLSRMKDKDIILKELSELSTTPNVDNFESYWMSAIGKTLYDKFIDKYSKKMWQIEDNKTLTANWNWVNRGSPIRKDDIRLYKDMYTAYPENIDGYNQYFIKMIQDVEIVFERTVNLIEQNKNGSIRIFHYDTNLDGLDPNMPHNNNKDWIIGKGEDFDLVITTASLDFINDNKFGKLHYAGRSVMPVVLPTKMAMPDKVFWSHYCGDEPYTRITEFNKFTGYQSKNTMLLFEFPNRDNTLYPLENEENLNLYKKYRDNLPKNVYPLGRLGLYHYNNIPEAIRDSIELCKSL